jgi:hypothetical protein
MLINDDVRTFPCRACGSVRSEWELSCKQCGLELSREQASQEAEQRERFLASFAGANSLVITARTIPVLLALSLFVPFLGIFLLLGTLCLCLVLPILILRWHLRYRHLDARYSEAPQVKKWMRQTLLAWGGSSAAAVLWAFFLFSR